MTTALLAVAAIAMTVLLSVIASVSVMSLWQRARESVPEHIKPFLNTSLTAISPMIQDSLPHIATAGLAGLRTIQDEVTLSAERTANPYDDIAARELVNQLERIAELLEYNAQQEQKRLQRFNLTVDEIAAANDMPDAIFKAPKDTDGD